MARGDRRDADVDRPPGDPQTDATVLRQPLLGDVELRHDLDPRHDGGGDRTLGLQRFAHHAIDPHAHHETVLERFDMDVRGVVAHRLGQQGVDEADDRRSILALEQVSLLGQVLGKEIEIDALL